MNEDGEDVRAYLCNLCHQEQAEDGETLCRSCIDATRTEPTYPAHVDAFLPHVVPTRQRSGVFYDPQWSRDCGRWLP